MDLGNFIVEEFVPKEVHDLVGDTAIKLVDPRIIKFMVNLRTALGRPITINTWKWGGEFSQRGIRTPDSKYYKPVTSSNKLTNNHPQGLAVDFTVEGMTAQEVREWIIEHRHLDWVNEINFIEDDVSWVHVDVRAVPNNVLVLWSVITGKSVVYS